MSGLKPKGVPQRLVYHSPPTCRISPRPVVIRPAVRCGVSAWCLFWSERRPWRGWGQPERRWETPLRARAKGATEFPTPRPAPSLTTACGVLFGGARVARNGRQLFESVYAEVRFKARSEWASAPSFFLSMQNSSSRRAPNGRQLKRNRTGEREARGLL